MSKERTLLDEIMYPRGWYDKPTKKVPEKTYYGGLDEPKKQMKEIARECDTCTRWAKHPDTCMRCKDRVTRKERMKEVSKWDKTRNANPKRNVAW